MIRVCVRRAHPGGVLLLLRALAPLDGGEGGVALLELLLALVEQQAAEGDLAAALLAGLVLERRQLPVQVEAERRIDLGEARLAQRLVEHLVREGPERCQALFSVKAK